MYGVGQRPQPQMQSVVQGQLTAARSATLAHDPSPTDSQLVLCIATLSPHVDFALHGNVDLRVRIRRAKARGRAARRDQYCRLTSTMES